MNYSSFLSDTCLEDNITFIVVGVVNVAITERNTRVVTYGKFNRIKTSENTKPAVKSTKNDVSSTL